MSDQLNAVNLDISHIADAVKVIDHAADEGAFRGWGNIRQILTLRDRLEAFVTAATAATTATTAEPASVITETATEETQPAARPRRAPRSR